METLTVVIGIVLSGGIVAAWDVARKQVAATRYNQATLDRLANIDRELERQHQQQQAILGKVNAAVGAQASRLPRSLGVRS